MSKDVDKKTVAAMACAVIAEDIGVDISRIRIKSFKKIEPSPLKKYLTENGIEFTKYTLEAERNG